MKIRTLRLSGKALHRHLQQADLARDRRDWNRAYHEYKKALALDPGLADIWVQHGHAAKELGRIDESIRLYRHALALSGDTPDIYLQLGHAYKLNGDRAAATTAYLRSHGLDTRQTHPAIELAAFGWSKSDIQQGLADDKYSDDTNRDGISMGLRGRPEAVVPSSYRDNNPDVDVLCRLGLVADAAQHYRLYGHREGRDILQSLIATPASRVFLLCPSFFKQCGIGEYARYMAISLRNAGYDVHEVRSTREFATYSAEQLQDSAIVVNHGPGLFDGYNPRLSEGEPTADLVANLISAFQQFNARPIIYLHSMLGQDNVEMYGRQALLLEAPIPTVTTIQSAAMHFHIPWIDHGLHPIEVSQGDPPDPKRRDMPRIGFFGFFHWGGKDFDALFNAAEALQGKLVGSVATVDQTQLDKLTELLRVRGIQCDIGTGWTSDVTLISRLREADYFYLPQNDYDHWNNSGTARFVTHLDRPLILPPHKPFLDMRDVAIFAEDYDVPAVIAWLRDQDSYDSAVERVRAFRTAAPMNKTIPQVVEELPVILRRQSLASFASPNAFSVSNLLMLPDRMFQVRIQQLWPDWDTEGTAASEPSARLEHLKKAPSSSMVLPYPRVDEIEVWRRNYILADLVFPHVQDIIFALFRYTLKREPSLIEYRRLRASIPVLAETSTPDIRRVVPWIARQVTRLAAQHGSEVGFPEIAISPELLDAEEPDVAWTAIQALSNVATQAYDRVDSDAASLLGFNSWTERNVFVLLVLPPDIVGEAIAQACNVSGRGIDFSKIGRIDGLRNRYHTLVEILAGSNMRLSDHFVCDFPVPNPVQPERRLYAMAELLLHDGDMFIINLVRSLLKRDPLTVEMFVLAEQHVALGYMGAVSWFAHNHRLNAHVLDLDRPDLMAQRLADGAGSEQQRVHRDFRSPVAGGWDQRNRYLEAKRNNNRLWLKLKPLKDLWWHQSGQNSAFIQI